MNFVNKNKTKCFWHKHAFCLMMALSVVLSLSFSKAVLAAESEGVEHFKVLSTIEYAGKGQFRNQAETLFTVRKQSLLDDKVRYFLSTNDFDVVGNNPNSGQQLSSKELAFVIDGKTRRLSETGADLALLEKVNNQCVGSLKKVTRENIGKTWKQSFNLSSLGDALPGELKFTLTAIQVKTKVFGEMIAVRALSEPFVVKTTKQSGGIEPVKSRIGAVYLFDPEIEDIYLSISVFEATTNINGSKEKLRCELATYKTDAAGVPVDLSGLGKNFEKFVRDLGLARKSLKVANESSFPQWARSEGLGVAQVANVCAAVACEGDLNPVIPVCIAAARTVELQSIGKSTTVGELGTVSGLLAKSVPGVGKIAAGPTILGMPLATAGIVLGGGTATAVAVGTSGSSESSRADVRSPYRP